MWCVRADRRRASGAWVRSILGTGGLHREHARLQRDASAAASVDRSELARVDRQIANIVEAVKQGLFARSIEAELDDPEARKLDLARKLESASDDAPAIHPGIARIYRRKVADLRAALNDGPAASEAIDIIRSLLGRIRLIPDGDRLLIGLEGNLAKLLWFAAAPNANARAVGAGGSTKLVAGAGFGLHLPFVSRGLATDLIGAKSNHN